MLTSQLPPCAPGSEANPTIDFSKSCAGGICAGIGFDDFKAIGEHSCEPSASGVVCETNSGVKVYFDDADGDGEPDADATISTVILMPEFEGKSSDGLGKGASLTCFIDAWGRPSTLKLEQDGAAYHISRATWRGPYRSTQVHSSGLVEGLTMGRLPKARPAGPKPITEHAWPSEDASRASAVLAEARWYPHRDNDENVDGLRVSSIRRDSVLDTAGLRNGDILHRFGEHAVITEADVEALGAAIAKGDAIELHLSRRGKSTSLTWKPGS